MPHDLFQYWKTFFVPRNQLSFLHEKCLFCLVCQRLIRKWIRKKIINFNDGEQGSKSTNLLFAGTIWREKFSCMRIDSGSDQLPMQFVWNNRFEQEIRWSGDDTTGIRINRKKIQSKMFFLFFPKLLYKGICIRQILYKTEKCTFPCFFCCQTT